MAQVFDGTEPNPQVADVYIVIEPPPSVPGGVPTNVYCTPGTADWGPKNLPLLVSSLEDGEQKFGPRKLAGSLDKHDLASSRELAFAQNQGGTTIRRWESRVSDGTDAQATCALEDTTAEDALVGATLKGKWTGADGNDLKAKIEAGSLTNTYTVTILPFAGAASEVYKNLPSSTFWESLVSAITNGWNERPPSELCVAVIGDEDAIAPALGTFTFSGGTSGRGVNSSQIVGADGADPTGIYVFRDKSPNGSLLSIPGFTDNASWATIGAFAKSAAMIAVVCFATGTTVSTAISTKKSLGIDSKYVIVLKDHVKYLDPLTKQYRLVTPDSVVCGRIASLNPHESPCNKVVYGIVGTERDKPYQLSDLELLEQAGINLVANPIPRGNVFGIRHGRNSSSDESVCAIEHTRMINYCVQLIKANAGEFVGEPQSEDDDDPTRKLIRDKFNAIFGDLRDRKVIQSWDVTCDRSNNSKVMIQRRFCRVRIRVKFLSSIWNLIIGLQGGTNVVTVQTQPAQQAA